MLRVAPAGRTDQLKVGAGDPVALLIGDTVADGPLKQSPPGSENAAVGAVVPDKAAPLYFHILVKVWKLYPPTQPVVAFTKSQAT